MSDKSHFYTQSSKGSTDIGHLTDMQFYGLMPLIISRQNKQIKGLERALNVEFSVGGLELLACGPKRVNESKMVIMTNL